MARASLSALTEENMGRNITKNEEKKHSFFKLLAGFNTECVRIPQNFLKHISKDLSERATLKRNDSSDSSWIVKVSKTREGAVYFKNGWEEFIKDNSLGTHNEMLEIFYEGKMYFSIRIFDQNGIERTEELLSSESSELKEIKEEEEGSKDSTSEDLEANFTKIGSLDNSTFAKKTTKRPRGRPRKYPVSSLKPLPPSNACKVDSGEELSSSESKEIKEEEEDSEDNTSEDLEAHFTKIGSLHNSTLAKNTTRRPCGRPRKYPMSSSKPLRTSNSCKVDSGEELSSSESKEIKEEEEDSEDNTSEDLEAHFTNIGSLDNSTFAKNTIKRPRGRPRKYAVSSSKRLRPSNSCKVDSGEEFSSSKSSELNEIKEEEEDSEDNTYEDLDGVEPEAFKSNFPYFKGVVRKTNCQFFPSAVSRKHFRKGKRFKAILKNAQGKK